MNNHLLSIFPIKGENVYARVSLIAFEETALMQIDPFTVGDRAELIQLLKGTSLEAEGKQLLANVEEGTFAQVAIRESDAVIIAIRSFRVGDQTPRSNVA